MKEFSAEIRAELEERIVEHYYLLKGTFEASFDNDNQLQAALEILNNNGDYVSLLKPAN